MDVPLREEVIPIHGIKVRLPVGLAKGFTCEPGGRSVKVVRRGERVEVEVPPLEVHQMLVAQM